MQSQATRRGIIPSNAIRSRLWEINMCIMDSGWTFYLSFSFLLFHPLLVVLWKHMHIYNLFVLKGCDISGRR